MKVVTRKSKQAQEEISSSRKIKFFRTLKFFEDPKDLYMNIDEVLGGSCNIFVPDSTFPKSELFPHLIPHYRLAVQ